MPLAAALARGDSVVDEVGEGGSVPHARVTNRGRHAVLVLFGEELVGAKQNRVANASFLVGARSEVVIDVSCVEAGRWGQRRRAGFAAGEGIASNLLRKKMALRVAQARAAGQGGFRADQGEVWDDVAESLELAGVHSPTGSWTDYATTRASDVADLVATFRSVPGQVGFVAAVGGEVTGLEVIGREEVFARVFPRLLRGYAVDAVDAALVREREERWREQQRAEAEAGGGRGSRFRAGRRGHPERDGWFGSALGTERPDAGPAQGPAIPPPRFDAPEPFLDALARAGTAGGPSLGLGTDLRLRGAGVAGCALVAGAVVHLTAFPAEAA